MRASPKEILNNKSNKMVDLILDEIRDGGSKTIAAGFTHDKTKKNYVLTVGVTVTDVETNVNTPEDLCENCSCNCKPQAPANDTENNTPTDTGNDTSNTGENTGNSSTEEEPTPNIPVVDTGDGG